MSRSTKRADRDRWNWNQTNVKHLNIRESDLHPTAPYRTTAHKAVVLAAAFWVWTCTFGFFSPAVDAATKQGAEKLSIVYCIDCVPFHFQGPDGKPTGMIIDLWRL